MSMFDSYPYTDFHEMNLDFILNLAKDSMGLHLEMVGEKLALKNLNGQTVSDVTVGYADKAWKDKEGNEISGYFLNVAGSGTALVFTRGDGTTKTIVVPYATKAQQDANGLEIDDYVYNVTVNADKLRIAHGDGTATEITVPYAVKATQDKNGKDISTYATALVVDGNNVRLNDSQGVQLSSITVPFATKAQKDIDSDDIKTTYAHSLTTGSTTVKLLNKAGNTLSEITVPYATHAANAIETVTISGDQVVFTTYGGQQTMLTIPYAVKAQKDDLGNIIKNSYVADVEQDSQTGDLVFKDAMGNTICTLELTAAVAIEDDYGNTIADYVKQIAVSSNSNYVTVTHGDGTVDTITIHYAETAWKDTNNNVIKNTYVKRIAILESPANSDDYYLVCYNGDNPEAELFRIKLIAVDYDSQTMDIHITIGGI